MKRPTLPTVLDAKDRQVLRVGLAAATLLVLALLIMAGAAGLAVRVFTLAAGW